jgi:parallel beta-helix repeat protein
MERCRPLLLLTLTSSLAAVGGGGAGGPGPAAGSPPAGTASALPWESGSYFPAWQSIQPTRTTPLSYDSARSAEENGAALVSAIAALKPGDRLQIGAGRWSVSSFWNLVVQGRADAPIWIVAAPGAAPVITRPDAKQNVMNVGSGDGSATRYVCFQGLEFTGGDTLIRLYHCENVWVDQCHIHDGDGVGITANTEDSRFLYITRNHIHNPGGPTATAEGLYLGANNSEARMSQSIVALNHIHDCRGTQGDGIEVKQGSYNNWIVENHVHDTNYPGITIYGTDGRGANMIERNTVYNSKDNVMQVQGEAIVRNNLIMNGATGFHSHDHQGQTRNLQVIHNTIINTSRATNLSSWNNRSGMLFANNAVYSQNAESISFPNGSAGVTVVGNVVLGPVAGVSSGYLIGNGLADFANLTWDATHRDAAPSASSALLGRADMAHAAPRDINDNLRTPPADAGAYDRP